MKRLFKRIQATKVLSLLSATLAVFALSGCSGDLIAEEEAYPDASYNKAWVDENTGNDENLGPNSPGYLGPDGEYSLYPDSDPR